MSIRMSAGRNTFDGFRDLRPYTYGSHDFSVFHRFNSGLVRLDGPVLAFTPMSSAPREEVQLSTLQASRFLGLAPRTVIRWANSGRIPCVRTGAGHRRFRLGDLEAILQTGRDSAPTRPEQATGS